MLNSVRVRSTRVPFQKARLPSRRSSSSPRLNRLGLPPPAGAAPACAPGAAADRLVRAGLAPAQDELHALQQDRQRPGFLDEIDGAAGQGGLLVDLVRQHGQEDHRNLDAAGPELAQHVDAVHLGHAPVEQDHVRVAAAQEIVERRGAAVEGDDLVSSSARFMPSDPEKVVVIDQGDLDGTAPAAGLVDTVAMGRLTA